MKIYKVKTDNYFYYCWFWKTISKVLKMAQYSYAVKNDNKIFD